MTGREVAALRRELRAEIAALRRELAELRVGARVVRGRLTKTEEAVSAVESVLELPTLPPAELL